ncbi:GNAT family N-acetyltransferase [Agaribacter marinus]|uniref:GNAT family N-acetyltransferase n=1 Tax=Virgibacillus salarius TaxID=447199 RepID=A0A941E094_9BACI|nr:GNAT family N-acetyltransferase [uncultured Virgibacillus sp.]MBR7798314.1 GNAT family N-acetyltransferase [Virgibacillus salarius]NAZ11022.1 GNAT family N-acetyltransferase [Agaribacter marinus]
MKKLNTPTIETDRLKLRKFSDDDLYDMFEIYHDEEVNKFLPWFPFQSIEETKEYLYNTIYKEYDQRIAYHYAIEEKANHKVIGYIGISKIDEEKGSAELGYGLLKTYWGKGIATEASKALLKRLKQDGFKSIFATNDVNNIGSGRVLEKSGMTYQYSYDERWQPKNNTVTFKLHRIDF